MLHQQRWWCIIYTLGLEPNGITHSTILRSHFTFCYSITCTVAHNKNTINLRCCDRSWDMLFDSPLMISKISVESLHEEAYNTVPQWAIIGNLLLGRFSRPAVNAIVSTLVQPTYGEFFDTMVHPHSLRVCFQIESDFCFPTSTKVRIKEMNDT